MTNGSHLTRTVRRLGAGPLAAALGLAALLPLRSRGEDALPTALTEAREPAQLALAQCLSEALQTNRATRISRISIEIAEAQHLQALSAYWPQLSARGGYEHLSAAPNFRFPASQFNVPAGTAMVQIPGGVVGPNPVQLPVSTPAQTISVPTQNVKLANPDNFTVTANATWLLFDGGMRRGLSAQTEGQVAAMQQEARRTDLEVADSVERLYYGAVLARELVKAGRETEQKLVATLSLTEQMYQGKAGSVTKLDWLDNRVVVESVRALVADLEKNQAMAEAALAVTMGRPWDASVRPVDTTIPFAPQTTRLDDLVEAALRRSPDWLEAQAAIRATEGGITTARSEHYPKLALIGDVRRWWNSYSAGLATEENRLSWSLGVGVDVPLFTGFATHNKVVEAEARLAKLREQQLMLKEGIGLRLKEVSLDLVASEKAVAATQAARDAAAEDCSLTIRAYQNGLVETEKVIRAQIAEAMTTAQHLKALFDHAEAASRIRLLVGGDASGDPAAAP